MRLGIVGGTFDPIHYGHLFIAEEARVRFSLDSVLFVPNGQPPHKKEYETTRPAHRFAMVRVAIHTNPAFSCSSVEVQRPGPSYTVDTLREIRRQMPEAEIFYITGIDATAEILSWNEHAEVIRLATFIAALRPGFEPVSLLERLPASYLQRILVLGTTAIGISSSDIRARVREQQPIRYLTPDGVCEYIHRQGLYRQAAAPTQAGGEQA
jgi:nicotinate-nucleotide adenylyltransferase